MLLTKRRGRRREQRKVPSSQQQQPVSLQLLNQTQATDLNHHFKNQQMVKPQHLAREFQA